MRCKIRHKKNRDDQNPIWNFTSHVKYCFAVQEERGLHPVSLRWKFMIFHNQFEYIMFVSCISFYFLGIYSFHARWLTCNKDRGTSSIKICCCWTIRSLGVKARYFLHLHNKTVLSNHFTPFSVKGFILYLLDSIYLVKHHITQLG